MRICVICLYIYIYRYVYILYSYVYVYTSQAQSTILWSKGGRERAIPGIWSMHAQTHIYGGVGPKHAGWVRPCSERTRSALKDHRAHSCSIVIVLLPRQGAPLRSDAVSPRRCSRRHFIYIYIYIHIHISTFMHICIYKKPKRPEEHHKNIKRPTTGHTSQLAI